MEYLVTGQEMKSWDAWTIRQLGIPSLVLMERAALGVVEALREFDLRKVLVVCGSGNNGGDGFAVARLLWEEQIPVSILFVGDRTHCTEETAAQMEVAFRCGIPIQDEEFSWQQYTTIVDALFGIGISRPVDGRYADCIKNMNDAPAEILAVDIPSGISADNGKVMGKAVRASVTVTFAYKKRGLVCHPGAEYAGKVLVKHIGVLVRAGETPALPHTISYCQEDLNRLPVRPAHSNKGTFGKVLVIAGSSTMSGAAYFSAKAAYLTGAGLVKLLTAEENRTVLQTLLPEAIVETYSGEEMKENALDALIQWAGTIVIGPGLGTSGIAACLLERVLSAACCPIVVDADGLNLLAEDESLFRRCFSQKKSDWIFTPHVGEMARLVRKEIAAVAGNLLEEAEHFVDAYPVVCVLKDARTVVAAGKEQPLYLNQSGNHGMATGGAGDVLSGILAGLLAQGMTAPEAARLGVYLHGLAGDRAAMSQGAYGLLAEDILIHLPKVMRMT